MRISTCSGNKSLLEGGERERFLNGNIYSYYNEIEQCWTCKMVLNTFMTGNTILLGWKWKFVHKEMLWGPRCEILTKKSKQTHTFLLKFIVIICKCEMSWWGLNILGHECIKKTTPNQYRNVWHELKCAPKNCTSKEVTHDCNCIQLWGNFAVP